MDSKEYSWKFLSASELLSRVACDLVYAVQVMKVVDAAAFTDFYNGESILDNVIVILPGSLLLAEFNPKEPVYCRRGLYVNVTGAIDGVFVLWRERSSIEG